MKRKILTIFLALVCTFCLAFGLTACDSLNSLLNDIQSQTDDNTDNNTDDGDQSNDQGDEQDDTQDDEQSNDQSGDQDDQQSGEQGKTETPEERTDSEGLEYTLSTDGKYYIVSGIGSCTDTDVVIPSTYEGLPVTEIAARTFKNQTQLTSVYVPDSVTSIGSGAFSGCSSLVSMTLPFVGDSAKTENDTYQYPFGYIFGTTEYTSGTATEQSILYSTGSPTVIPTNISYYEIFTKNTYYIPTTLTTVTITGGNILSYAFHNCTLLESITIPNSATSIGNYAFYNCASLENITLPDNVTYIGYSAFYNCASLENIALPDNVTYIGHYAFYDCTSLKNITLHDNLTSIGNYAFHNTAYYNDINNWENDVLYMGNYLIAANTSISGSYAIKDGTTIIANYAFYECISLTSITIPDSVTTIGGCAFNNCTLLTSINVSSGNTAYKSIDGNLYSYDGTVLIQYAIGKTDTSFTIPDSVTSIGFCAFDGCTSLESITIGSSVTSIGYYAFNGCTALASIAIGSGITSIGSGAFYDTAYYNDSNNWENKVLYIGNYLIAANTSISGDYTIKDGTKVIADSAFYDCTSLESVTIPDSVTSIGSCTFQNCISLESVIIGNGVTSIGIWAFGHCWSLTSITIPNSVTSIDCVAFDGCSSLKSVIIGSGVTSIGRTAFFNCTSLESVTFINTSGWYVTQTSEDASGTDITSDDLLDTSTAAEYLTSTYYYYYWYRSES